MSKRIHIVVDEREREAFRARAATEGRSLSEWLREAARERLRTTGPDELRNRSDLASFFAECDLREQGREPDWDEHVEVIEASRRAGLPPT
ncbi:MAG: plasmid mobilization protein [Egibacteraceae bacterium]